MNEPQKQELGQRIRRLRIQQGITQAQASTSAGVRVATWRFWERGDRAHQPWRSPQIASALGVPVAQLFTDTPIIAEVTLSPETLAKVKAEGREAAQEAAKRLASMLEPLIYEAATRKPVDTRPGARAAKKRMTRAERLAGLRAADRARREARKRRID